MPPLQPTFRCFLLVAVLTIIPLNVRFIFKDSFFDEEPSIQSASFSTASEDAEAGEEETGSEREYLGMSKKVKSSTSPDIIVDKLEEETSQHSGTPHHHGKKKQKEKRKQPTDDQVDKRQRETLVSIASKDDPDTFAACIQIMDDNHFLIEWLAYHYHVLPLRRLIVLVDPYSSTTPEPILNRWEDRINITVWHERDIFPTGIPPPPDKKKKPTKLGQHRSRQKKFLSKCQKTLFKEGRGWAVLTDTDEYTMINDRLRTNMTKDWDSENTTLPSQEEPGSVMKLLRNKDMKQLVTKESLPSMVCITMARRQFATAAYKPEGGSQTALVSGYNSTHFQTLNWRYYAKLFKPGKALVNLSKLNYSDIPDTPSVHRPITDKKICAGKLSVVEEDSVFAVNHYPGNLHQMLFRTSDARGNATNATAYRVERFNQQKAFTQRVDSPAIQRWLPGFIASVGEDEAYRLLEYVGLPEKAATYVTSRPPIPGAAEA